MWTGSPAPNFVPLADWLHARRDLITTQWLAAVHGDRELPTVEQLTFHQLLNRLPAIFDDLTARLRDTPPAGGDQPTPPSNQDQTARDAREHGHERWQQGYELDELLRELAAMRGVMVGHLGVFEQGQPDLATPAWRVRVHRLIHGFLDEVAMDSTRQFMDEARAEATARNRQLEQLGDSRLRLTRTVAHELHNLLGACHGATELLATGGAGDLIARGIALPMLRRNAADMDRLVNQLLDYSVLLAGHGTLRAAPFSLHGLTDELAVTFLPQALAKGLRFEAAPCPPWRDLVGDELKVKQVAANLVSNAIKYTPPGGRVRVGFERADDAGNWTMTVEDTGVGIAPEDLGAIFEEFHRVPATAHLRGTGLGLAITRQLVAQMGGRIEVRSRPGEGSCFRVTLPGSPVHAPGVGVCIPAPPVSQQSL